MTVRTRLLLLITLLVTVCTLVTAGTLAWLAWRSILSRAEEDAVLMARLLADSASVSEQISLEVENLLGEKMVTDALLAGQLVELGQDYAADPRTMRQLLQLAVARTGLDEIWITDNWGTVRLSSMDEVDESIVEDFDFGDIAVLAPLFGGAVADVVTGPIHRAVDDKSFVYAGVRMDSGAALVGHNVDFMANLRERLGLQRLIDTLLGGRSVAAIWIFDESLAILASGTTGQEDHPLAAENQLAATAMNGGHHATQLTADHLSVAVPILDIDRVPAGAALVRLPTARLLNEIHSYFIYALGLSAGLLVVGLGATALTARYLSEPIMRITSAAQAVEQRRFEPALLDPVRRRSDELGRLANVFRDMAVELLDRERELDQLVRERTAELEHKTEELGRAYAQIDQELVAAQSLQRAILPQDFPNSSEFKGYALMWPARQLAGDFYDVLELPDGRLGVLVADVSGKGVPAAFFMGISRTVLRAAASEGQSPGTCLARANDVLCRTNPMSLFVTVFYGILDPRDGSFLYANGGHNPPLLVRSGTKLPLPLEGTGSLVLGALEGIPYGERSVTLEPGESLILYTDGVTEAQNAAGEEFAEERLTRAAAESQSFDPPAVVAHVTEAVRRFVAGEPLADDLTCVVLRYTGPAGLVS